MNKNKTIFCIFFKCEFYIFVCLNIFQVERMGQPSHVGPKWPTCTRFGLDPAQPIRLDRNGSSQKEKERVGGVVRCSGGRKINEIMTVTVTMEKEKEKGEDWLLWVALHCR